MWSTGPVDHQRVKCGPKCADHFSSPLGKMWMMKMWTRTDTTDEIIHEREAEWTDNKGPCDKWCRPAIAKGRYSQSAV